MHFSFSECFIGITIFCRVRDQLKNFVAKFAEAFGKPALNSLRHSFATRYHKENNDVPRLKNQWGHSSIQTTMIYTHITDDEMQSAINNMDKI
ncbi:MULTISPECIES: tyrosine-type recombinase/integrase [Paenibacillus]|uniref:tyrosine-type recombinase/integrase n=1 Tax=Paenibacillus TaxID=44249 RepID=UPI003520B968